MYLRWWVYVDLQFVSHTLKKSVMQMWWHSPQIKPQKTNAYNPFHHIYSLDLILFARILCFSLLSLHTWSYISTFMPGHHIFPSFCVCVCQFVEKHSSKKKCKEAERKEKYEETTKKKTFVTTSGQTQTWKRRRKLFTELCLCKKKNLFFPRSLHRNCDSCSVII